MNTKEYSEATSEVLEIIKYLDDDEIAKIPLDFIQKLNQKKSDTYIPNIDFTKPLEENNLRRETLAILGIIYKDYLATDEERIEFEAILDENSKINYKENIFDKKEKDNIENSLLVPIEKKKNVLQRFFDKLLKR